MAVNEDNTEPYHGFKDISVVRRGQYYYLTYTGNDSDYSRLKDKEIGQNMVERSLGTAKLDDHTCVLDCMKSIAGL